jgi:hypothetical protein
MITRLWHGWTALALLSRHSGRAYHFETSSFRAVPARASAGGTQ